LFICSQNVNKSKLTEEYKKSGVVLDENEQPIPTHKILNEQLPWQINHPGWGDFTAHKITKWKHRFVVTALNGEQQAIIGFLNKSTGLHYSCIEFSEKKLFPDLDESYQITCAYFFPTEERDYCADITNHDISECYWY